jgi:hypothetical protein
MSAIPLGVSNLLPTVHSRDDLHYAVGRTPARVHTEHLV